MTLHLVCDTSGSMGENAKPFVVRTCVLTIAQYVRLGYASADAKLYRWADDLVEAADWTVDDEFPEEFHQCEGRSSARALAGLEFSDGDRVMLLTDGFWATKEAKEIREWMGGVPDDLFLLVKVGADAAPQLTGKSVFFPEEILAAMYGWLPEAAR